MSQKKNLFEYFVPTKKTKENPRNEEASGTAIVNVVETEFMAEQSSSKDLNNLPSGWNQKQKLEFIAKNPWLVVLNGKLGCSVCKNVGSLGTEKQQGLKLEHSWIDCNISPNGLTITQNQTSLRKKIFEHRKSAAHLKAEKIGSIQDKNIMAGVLADMHKKEFVVTERVFRTAYKQAKLNHPSYGFEAEVDVQILNGVDMGKILHSNVACTNILMHISEQMQRTLLKKIIDSKPKFGIILDESTSLSNNSCLIVYIRVQLINMTHPENLFLRLIELQRQNAECIFATLLAEFNILGLTEAILQECLVSLTCDGAAVMLGRKSGVAKLFLEKYPNLIIWHCLNHRLELCVGDTVKEITGVNHLRTIVDKIRTLYHSSPKNQRELKLCSQSLEQVILKIGRILDVRWVSSSLRTVKALWIDYPALFKHFSEASNDARRDEYEKAKFRGLALKITSIAFVQNLGLMYDAMMELSHLSLKLEERKCSIITAHQEICLQVRIFESMVDQPGRYYSEAIAAVQNKNFRGVELVTGNKTDVIISSGQFYRSLANNLRSRMFLIGHNDANESEKLLTQFKVLYPESSMWPEIKKYGIRYGEEEVCLLSQRFNVNQDIVMRDFRTFIDTTGGEIRTNLNQLFTAISTIAISSAECERGFSAMNLIVTPTRSSLLTKTLSNLLFIKLVGPPLTYFDPKIYVRSWLAKGKHSALDSQSRSRSAKVYDENMEKIWNLL